MMAYEDVMKDELAVLKWLSKIVSSNFVQCPVFISNIILG